MEDEIWTLSSKWWLVFRWMASFKQFPLNFEVRITWRDVRPTKHRNGTIMRRVTGNFIATRGLWVRCLLAKIKLLLAGEGGGQNIAHGAYLRGCGARRVIQESQVSPPCRLLFYCIVNTPRCTILEQVFSLLVSFYRLHRLPSRFIIVPLIPLSPIFLFSGPLDLSLFVFLAFLIMFFLLYLLCNAKQQ